MLGRRITVGLGSVIVASASMLSFATTAHADYAPSTSDVVGVGSDTVQLIGDFIADGDHLLDPGYNTGKKNKFISIDATADVNTRLAYGINGAGPTCTPGTGGTEGTGNQNVNHTETPAKPVCSLNPTVVLRSGTSPVQRPNGSGSGKNLIKADTNASGGYRDPAGPLVDWARSSSAYASGAGDTRFDSVQLGTDPLGMLTAPTGTTNAPATLTVTQIHDIYTCATTNWSTIGGTAGTIKPLLPQAGSGTRSYFLTAIGLNETNIGTSCGITNAEENDPEALDATGNAANAIEPMSQSRLYAYQGKLGDGTSNGVGGYYHDPSCVAISASANCPHPTGDPVNGPALTPNVRFMGVADNGTWVSNRPLFIYFRHSDLSSTKKFQPGGTLNWVRTMLYNPGGAATPYVCSGAGQALIMAAGVTPTDCTLPSYYIAGGA
jgi:hypothetical protein